MYRCEKCNKVTTPGRPASYLYEYRNKEYKPQPKKRTKAKARKGFRPPQYVEDTLREYDRNRGERTPAPTTYGYEIAREIKVCIGCFLDEREEASKKAQQEQDLLSQASR